MRLACAARLGFGPPPLHNEPMLKLYTYYRSVSTHRVRIALNIKGVPYEPVFVDQDSGQQHSAEYLELNPQGLVPALRVGNQVITQSFAILEYLEERYPERRLLPDDVHLRAQVRSFSQIAVADMHPLNILRVFHYMRDDMALAKDQRRAWYEHWAHKGFAAMEWMLANGEQHFYAFGDAPTLADVCLVPQVYNGLKSGLDMSPYEHLRRIYLTCSALSAFQAAAPEAQSDVFRPK